jgi:hypothetical protein
MLPLPGRVRVQNGLDSVDRTEPNKHPIQATVLAEYSSRIGSDNYFSEKYKYQFGRFSTVLSERAFGLAERCAAEWFGLGISTIWNVQPAALARLMRRLILRAIRSAVG